MSIANWVVNTTIKNLTGLVCQVDDNQLSKVPKQGPLILVANHINFLDVPVVYTRLQPRQVTGFVKAETWKNPLMGFLFNLWRGIPLRRGEADIEAVRKALAALEAGRIVAVAPEGTRSGHGRLQRGHPGVVILALRSQAPLMPIVYYGGERFRDNLRRLQRTDFHIVVGKQFRIDIDKVRITHQVRQQIADEIMYQMAALLPPAYRGRYDDLSKSTQTYLRFDL